MRRVAAAMLMTAMVLVACSGDGEEATPGDTPEESQVALEGTTWVLDQSSIAALSGSAPTDARVDLTLEMGKARGLAACNNYNGSYTLDDPSLSFGEMAMTMMACEPAVSDLETAYMAALAEVDGYAISGDMLTLTGGDSSLSFGSEEPASLTGTTWNATMINNGKDAIVTAVADPPPTAVFGDDGTISGSDGCNTYGGEYMTDGDIIGIGPLRTTKMACADEEVSQQAAQFTQALQGAGFYELTGSELTLRSEGGSIMAMFEAAG